MFHTVFFDFIFRSEVMNDLGTSAPWSRQERFVVVVVVVVTVVLHLMSL